LLDSLGCRYETDITAIRNFEYYTGVCFQLLDNGERIAGGGRYDGLIPLMSDRNTPACGFALYIDPIMKLLPWDNKQKPVILIAAEQPTPEVVKRCFALAQLLRDAKHVAEVDLSGRERSDYRWLVSISEKDPTWFTITDCERKQRRHVASLSEVLSVVVG